jgi:hypothetical protein
MTTQQTGQWLTCRELFIRGVIQLVLIWPGLLIGVRWGFSVGILYSGIVFIVIVIVAAFYPLIWQPTPLPKLAARRVLLEMASVGLLMIAISLLHYFGIVRTFWVYLIPLAAGIGYFSTDPTLRPQQRTPQGDPILPRQLSDQSKHRIRLEVALVGGAFIAAGALHGLGIVSTVGIYAIPIALGVGILFVEPEMWGGQASEGDR